MRDATRLSLIYGAYGDGENRHRCARTAFAGESPDEETGWYLLGVRPYSQALRRFLSPDGHGPFDDGGLNRYSYCEGDPVNRIDPMGTTWWSWLKKLWKGSIPPAMRLPAAHAATPAISALQYLNRPRIVGLTQVREGPGYVTTSYTFRQMKSQIVHHEGPGVLDTMIPHRAGTDELTGERRIVPTWLTVTNSSGGVNYAADAIVTTHDVRRVMRTVGDLDQDTRPIILLSGVHGKPEGMNWDDGRRLDADQALYELDKDNLPNYTSDARRTSGEISVVNAGGIGGDEFIDLIDRPAHIIHGFCFGAADRVLMTKYEVKLVNVYEL